MRDNNLNLIRLLAAVAVIVSHSYPLALGAGTPEPLHGLLGIDLGKAAVKCFFAVSGFLVLRSLDHSRALDFCVARAARIFPALLVACLLETFLVGPLFSTDPHYLARPLTWDYPLRSLTLPALPAALPGLFEHLPLPGANGPLWTLHYEVACYLALLLCGLAGLARRRTFPLALVAYTAFYAVTATSYAATLSLPFVCGMACYRFAVPLHWLGVVAVAGAAALARASGAPSNELITIAISYATLTLGFARTPALWTFNRLGDYSYGLYIYAWPIQQMVMTLRPGSSPGFLMSAAIVLTLPVAILSWSLIESPALRWKSERLARRRASVARPKAPDMVASAIA